MFNLRWLSEAILPAKMTKWHAVQLVKEQEKVTLSGAA